jgi:3-hydroxyisobutyrate dehydrogenase-like beta-hydroxyacid dehydrogenase
MINVGFIGLGNMGLPMARNILRAGHKLTAYNRTRSRAEELVKDGANIVESPSDAAANAEIVISMLADDNAVKGVVWADRSNTGLLGSLAGNAVHVSMSTISIALSQQMSEAHKAKGQHYVSAPVFGRPEAAAAAKLWIVAAGEAEQVDRCQPVFDAMGQGVFRVGGEPSRANVVKVAGNFLIAAMLEAMGESFALVKKAGVDVTQFLEIINSLFRSPVYQSYGSLIATEKYTPAGFKLELGLKDVRLALEAAEATATPVPLASLIRDHLVSGIARGYGDLDWSALARVVADDAGISTGEERGV